MAGAASPRSLPELPPSSRYELLFKLAQGGMASVYVGRLRGAGGFWRLVAIKKAHAHLMEDVAFRRMLVDEARLASKIHHPNVVAVLDVEQVDGELLLVMDYIEGASLAEVIAARDKLTLPPRLAVRIALDACAGLHAAHHLTDASGKPLHIVHRDVSPQNLLVGVDGVSRLTDFGIAKSAQQQASTTTTGALKGKLAYMAPEYVDGKPPDARSDVFGLGVVIWEALANRRLFRGESEVDTLKRIVNTQAPLLSSVAPWVGTDLDPVLSAALAKDPNERFTSAKALGTALEIAARRADLVGSAEEVGAHVRALFEESLAERRRLIQDRVAADAGPSSGRPTNPMPQRRDGANERAEPDPGAAAPHAPATDARVVPAVTAVRTNAVRSSAVRALAKTVNDNELAPPAESTLDGSGVSHPGSDSHAPDAARSRRTAWFVAAGGALLAGALLALAVGPWTSGAPESPSAEPESRSPASISVTAASVQADPPPIPSAAFPSAAFPGATPTARASASPSLSGSARKPPPKPTSAATVSAAATAPESIPPNPYGKP